MALHKDSHHNCYRLTKFVSKHWYIPTIVLVVQIKNMIAHFTILFVLIVLTKLV